MKVLQTRLDQYDNSWFKPGNPFKRILWYYTNTLIFNNGFFPFSGLKVMLLKLFGAKIGQGVVIKPHVNIKYPWFLSIGDHTWIGEKVWIDNLCEVRIGAHCCLSQEAFLLTGNHHYKKSTFDLMTRPIILEDGVWIGAKATVAPGVVCYSHSLLTVGSIAVKNLEAFSIYSGNPATKVRERIIES